MDMFTRSRQTSVKRIHDSVQYPKGIGSGRAIYFSSPATYTHDSTSLPSASELLPMLLTFKNG